MQQNEAAWEKYADEMEEKLTKYQTEIKQLKSKSDTMRAEKEELE